ncbi:hypothetical protein DB30_06569 [Enhygromyxa salina]|uniref:FeoB-associated Cys-rich membrane protein n=1 Tax=Enhygromyxa salina TaxID=215803 RepID=A0A0C2A6E9_9BACT|nr:hypothetical protein [Enhygromyxa salina]KIG18958.1 hypothetical protein DB30_06569 [Enhygromyxa salina]
MLELPQWFHELATLTTLGVASGWLAVHWLRIGKPRGAQPGCARCDHNTLAPAREGARHDSAIRSKRLRVVG